MSALAAQNSALAQQISDREREIADAQTVAWLEQEARQLGYIFPGEQLYVIVPAGRGTRLDRRRVGADPDLQTAAVADPEAVADAQAERVAEPQPEPRPTPTPTALRSRRRRRTDAGRAEEARATCGIL